MSTTPSSRVGGTLAGRIALLFAASLAIGACKRTQPTAPSAPVPLVPVASVAADSASGDASSANGPAAQLRHVVPGEHCELTAAWQNTGSTTTATLEVMLESRDNFHINDLDEVQLTLEATGAQVPATLARTDANESSPTQIKFVIPATVQGERPSVRGRLRFSVCADVCVRQRLSFHVGIAP